MADTKGLLATRAAYMEAKTNGETELSHADWYTAKVKSDQARAAVEVKAAYDKVAKK